MLEKKVDITELRQLSIYVKNRSRAIRNQLNGLRRAFRDVVMSAGMKGGAKDAFDHNIINVYIPIIDALEEMYHELDDTVTGMLDDVQEHMSEYARNGVIRETAVHNYKEVVENHHNTVQELSQSLQASYNKISDLSPVSMPSRAPYDAVRISLTNDLRQVSERLATLEVNIAPLTDLYDMVRREVNRVDNEVRTRNDSNWSIPSIPSFTNRVRGLREARQQAAGFEGRFSIFGDRGGWAFCEIWRGEHADQAFADYLALSHQGRVDHLVESFFDSEGTLDWVRVVTDLLEAGISHEFTKTQWTALIAILNHPNTTPYNIVHMFHTMMSRAPGGVDDYPGRINSLYGTLISFSSDVKTWQDMAQESDILETLNQITTIFQGRSNELAFEHIWGIRRPIWETQRTDDDVFFAMRRAQLFTFLNSLSAPELRAEALIGAGGSYWDFSGFDLGGQLDFNEIDPLRAIRGEYNIPGHIIYNGNYYFLSGMMSLNENFSSERGSYLEFVNRQNEISAVPSGWDAFIASVGLATLVPNVVPSGINNTLKTYYGSSYIKTIVDFINRESTLTKIEQNWTYIQLARMFGDLGGAIIYVETPHGHVPLFSGYTHNVYINRAFLETLPYSSEDLAALIMIERFRTDYFIGHNTEALDAFKEGLEHTLETRFELISSDLRNHYPLVMNETPLNLLPEAVLIELINIHFATN